MAVGGNADLAVGRTVARAGFFTKAAYLRGMQAPVVEANLGYRAGRLATGWWLLFLTEMPGVDDFEVRGYSQMSGGVIQGHLNPADRRTAEDRLRDSGHDLRRIKQGLIAGTFSLMGSGRLAKVVPKAGPLGDPLEPDYPPGRGVPQWTLLRPLGWKVAAVMGPGDVYSGMYV